MADAPRIAYVHLSYGMSRPHEKRLEALARGARQSGIDNIDFIFINSVMEGERGGVRYVRYGSALPPAVYLDFLIRRYSVIDRAMEAGKYDMLILRYPNGDPSGQAFTGRYPVITEHHSAEIPEIRSHLSRKGKPLVTAMKVVRLGLEKTYGWKILTNARGIIGVTDEIRKYELGRIGKPKPSCVIPNGITVEDIPMTGFKPFDGKNLDMILLASSLQPWHGIDRIIRSINCYKGPVRITLHIVGGVTQGSLSRITPDLSKTRLHGFMERNELDRIMTSMNVAVGSLAMFRNNIREGCTLKAREYTARGIPFILAYSDSDLDVVDKGNDFYLTFENDNSLLDMDRVIDFVTSISTGSKSEEISRLMRSHALAHMAWTVKVKRYKDFTGQVLGQARSNI